MATVTAGVSAIVSLLLGVGLFIVIIRVSNLLDKVTCHLGKKKKKLNLV